MEASVGYIDAQLDDLDNVPMAVLPPGLVEGNALPFAPEWQAHLGLSYSQPIGRFELTPRVDVSYQDTTQFDATNTREIAQLDDVTTVNASLVFSSGAQWRVTLGVNNATDEQYPIAGNSSLTTGSGYAEIAYSRPREWFGNFTYDF
jgi:iron complex outermembrane receptor protein